MSIVGIGTDIVETDRIRRLLARHGDRFLARLLTGDERRELESVADAAPYVARRFAAKEAAAKALGTGIADGVSFQDFNIGHDARGRPLLRLEGRAREIARRSGVSGVHLSISDERSHAVAFVVLD